VLIASRLMPHVPPRVLMAPGAVVAAAGMALLTQLHADSGYLTLGIAVRKSCWASASLAVMVPAFSTGDPWGRPSRGRSCVGDRQQPRSRSADR